MNYFEKDTLYSTLEDAINPDNPSEVVFPKGTQVKLVIVKENELVFEYPNKAQFPIPYKYASRLFSPLNKKSKTLSITHEGQGTPPINEKLMTFLPLSMDWQKNYKWTMYIEVEELNTKSLICSDCMSEIKPDSDKSEEGRRYCDNCKLFVSVIVPTL